MEDVLKQPVEPWGFTLGKYEYTSSLKGLSNMGETINGIEFRGDEIILAEYIKNHTKLIRKSPLRMIDVGSMQSSTWYKLEKAFQKEIQDKKLELYCLNLKFKPNEPSSINFLVGSINDLLTMPEVTQKFDFIYENSAATYHSITPELERAKLLSLLASQGIYRGDRSLEQRENTFIRQSLIRIMGNETSNEVVLERRRALDVQELKLRKSPEWKLHDEYAVGNQILPLNPGAILIEKL